MSVNPEIASADDGSALPQARRQHEDARCEKALKRRVVRRLLPLAGIVAAMVPGSVQSQTAPSVVPPSASTVESPASLRAMRHSFFDPPSAARPMMRWWWFGPAVVDQELARELDAMHGAGIGGVELAAEYPLALDDPARGIVNLRYGSPEYVAAVRFAADHARALGMRVDLTLGSGWPFGGPEIPLSLAAGRLKVVVMPLTSAAAAPPHPVEGDSFLAAFVAKGTVQHYDAATAKRLPGEALPTILAAASVEGEPAVEIFFFASHTRQMVKRAAFGGEGYVLDHMARPAIEKHLDVVGNALLKGFPVQPPYAIFSDSLEAYGADWTPALPQEFQHRRGYDLLAHLPELAQGGTPEAEGVRHDWGQTLAELVNENYLRPVAAYATAHGTKFRSQTYGEPAVTLADEATPQLPEGEGPQWRSFSFTRWASSANHVYGKPVTSAETWTWLHSPAWRATPLDMKAEADRMFLEGVNQVIGHGFPYSAPGVEEPGWSLYAAAALNDHNPWWPVMPYITRYLTRVSWALRQGSPANDIALLLPEADAQAAFRPGHVSVTAEMGAHVTPALMGAILDAGYNLDYIDLAAAQRQGLHYPVVVVPPTTRMTLQGVRVLERYVAQGGRLIFLGQIPVMAAGLADAADTPAVQSGIAQLAAHATQVRSEEDLPNALAQALAPDAVLGPAAGKVGFLHRHAANLDLYFFANTTPDLVHWPLQVRARRPQAEWWDPDTGQVTAAQLGGEVELPPYGSRLLVLHERQNSTESAPQDASLHDTGQAPLTLGGWTLSFDHRSPDTSAMPVHSAGSSTLWTDDPATRFFSGKVTYTTSFQTSKLSAGQHLVLQFAPGRALPNTQAPNQPGMRAWYEPPVREAALVFVNGQQVGALWHPPYRLDISAAVHAGRNSIALEVFNTATNELAGQPLRDYTALKARYGDRFQMQDMQNLQPVPSGIVGPVELRYEQAATGNREKAQP